MKILMVMAMIRTNCFQILPAGVAPGTDCHDGEELFIQMPKSSVMV